MWPGGLQPETKGSPRRGKQNIEKKNTENKIEKSTIKTELIKVNCVTKIQDERWRILVI